MESIIENIFEIKNKSGFDLDDLNEAELRLNIKLPEVFKNFYNTYANHPMLNEDFGFAHPSRFTLGNSEWLVFYGGTSGVYWWAINKHDFNKKEITVYINFDGHGYKKEASSFEDFLMLRIFEYAHYIFPFRLQYSKLNKLQMEKIWKITENFNFLVQNQNYLNRKIYWNNTDEFLGIIELLSGEFSVSILSKKASSIDKYQKLFPQLKGRILPDRTWKKNDSASFVEDDSKLNTSNELSSDSNNTTNDNEAQNENFDLPF